MWGVMMISKPSRPMVWLPLHSHFDVITLSVYRVQSLTALDSICGVTASDYMRFAIRAVLASVYVTFQAIRDT